LKIIIFRFWRYLSMELSGNKKLLTVIVSFLFLPCINLFAQAGGAAVPFLLISPDARSSGMGEVGTAIADDINAVYWNPAGLGFHDYYENPADPDDLQEYRQLALSYSKWLPQFNADLFYSYATYGQYIEALDGTVAGSFIFMNLGEFTRTHESGRELGKFLSSEFAVGISYGTIVAEDLSVGFQLRYIQSNLAPASPQQSEGAGTGISGGFDLGVLWKPQNLDIFGWRIGDKLALGMNLQNVGPKMTYRNEADPLPTTLRLATAIKLFENEFNQLTFAFDYAKLLVKRDEIDSDPLPKSLITGWQNPGAEYALGLEYWYEQLIALRAGYFTEPSAIGDRTFWNFGAGVRYDMFEIDFSYINTIEENHPLANTMRFSMLVDFR
jgi:hypothetical protein